MSEEENIDEMYSRFTSIVNELRSLGKIYSPHDRIRKIHGDQWLQQSLKLKI